MRFASLLLSAALVGGSASAIAREEEPAGQAGGGPVAAELPLTVQTPREEQAMSAMTRALDWLAQQQRQTVDGSFPKARETEKHAPIGVAALSALAFMSAGTTQDRGPHGEALSRAVDYLLSRVDLVPGSATYGYISADGDGHSGMHGHGYATLALAEAHTASPSSPRGRRIGTALRAAVALIQNTQGVEGAWEYKPQRMTQHEGSITICLVQALRAARESGIHVDGTVIQRAEDYVLRSQHADGAFQYTLYDKDRRSIALTAAAVATLNATGTYSGEVIDRGTDAIWRYLTAREEGLREASPWPFYERFYVAQAFWQHHERQHFERWWPRELERMLEQQRTDGSWQDRAYGDCYATAMNCLVLAMPEALLPIFQR